MEEYSKTYQFLNDKLAPRYNSRGERINEVYDYQYETDLYVAYDGAVELGVGFFSWSGSAVPFHQSLKTRMELLLSHKFQKVKDWASRHIRYPNGENKKGKQLR